MASLTTDQIAILRWIVDSGEDTVMFAEGPGWATVVAGSANLEVNAADIRELEAQGLIQLVRGHLRSDQRRASYLRGAHHFAAA